MTLPTIQKPAPDFKGTAMHNGDFRDISLSDYKGKYVVLFFYPMDFTFVCPTEILAFSDKAEEFKKLNCELIGCSIDSKFTHLAWYNTDRKEGGISGIQIPLLQDVSHEIGNAYGVLTDGGPALRGTFMIDKEGTLRTMVVNDLPVGRSVDETLRTLKALQFTEEHGEVCPAGWDDGALTIKPNPKDSKEYFGKANG